MNAYSTHHELMSNNTNQLGAIFTWAGWIIGLLMLVLLFNKVFDMQNTPVSSINHSGEHPYIETILQRNRNGHYVFNGLINNKKVKFLVDTGATVTSIPISLAQSLNLEQGRAYPIETANGTSTAYATHIQSLSLGAIQLDNVAGSLVTGMNGNAALLGMNVLKHFELIQRGNKLIIRHYQ